LSRACTTTARLCPREKEITVSLNTHRATSGRLLLGAVVAAGLVASPASAATKEAKPVKIPSTPQNVVYGGFPIDRGAIARVQQGRAVTIDTLSSVGITVPDVSPTDYFGKLGVKPRDVLSDATAFWKTLPTRVKYGGVHTVTGPVNVAGAEPGDTLEIEVLDLKTRVPYGVNLTAPDSGVFSTTYPGFRPGDAPLEIPTAPADAIAGLSPNVRQHLLRTGTSKRPATKGEEVVFFAKGVEVPLHKFMGVMAVKPADGAYVGYTPTAGPYPDGVQSSVPPGPYGGNLDVRDLTVGSKLYLPVFQKGAGFYTGDSHSVQGDGEVSGTANEQSLVGTFKFKVHKRRSTGPMAEDAKNWLIMGIDHDLDRALKFSVQRAVKFLVARKRMTVAKAYSFVSIAVDFTISEAVDRTQVVTARIPKDVFFKSGKVKAGALTEKAALKKAAAKAQVDLHDHGH
jgi:acetamidase/formamidase